MGLYTGTGDGGQTDLLGGVRVSKTDPRIVCCGDIDEINAALGLARSLCKTPYVQETVETFQRRLFSLAGELAGGKAELEQRDIEALESTTDYAMEQVGGMTGFITPGGDSGSAALHLARTVVRRAERDLVAWTGSAREPRALLLAYLNRLSDAIYALARLEEKRAAD